MKGISNVLQIHLRQKLTWFYLPWAVVLFSFMINMLVSALIGDGAFYTGGLITIFVFMFVTAMTTTIQLFPFSIGFSIRRSDFFAGTLIFIMLISMITAIILLLLGGIEVWTGAWGDSIYFFHLPYLHDGPILIQFLMYVILLTSISLIGVGIGSFFLRFRGIRTFIMLAVVAVMLSALALIATSGGWWKAIFDWFADNTAFQLSLWFIPISFVIAICSRQFLRKATV
ncbi:hypothetical protein JCM10914A_51700 [Paenibacillus sp. JCM 10914]|uniref:hypothetical protein n=1 Tax=Paenibacillus sp. JCM 10914 TaxID=1236974 RepID=UPI0003CC570A|nr:hypothetical protein [Paenibacillus sp. JCM 10914]GAE05136.1 putative integral membrane protein [Paenibacillus sp. JCM 10914]